MQNSTVLSENLALKREIRSLRATLDALQNSVKSHDEAHEEELDDLKDRISLYKLRMKWRWIFFLYGMLFGGIASASLMFLYWMFSIGN